MSDIQFKITWFTGQTSCSICLLYYTKKKPVKIHDAKAMKSHFDGQVHRTAVSQLLVKRGTHTKIKAAALNLKAPKGVKINLPNNNNNFWRYALLQPPTQISAQTTSSTTSSAPSTAQ